MNEEERFALGLIVGVGTILLLMLLFAFLFGGM